MRYIILFLIALFPSILFAQTKDIVGQVTDEKGEALIGVRVSVKGTSEGKATDVNGSFTMTVPKDAVLKFSYTGYKDMEVKVGKETVIKVTMASKENYLEEYVVVGYQTVKRKDLTGSVSSVNSKQIRDVPVNSAAEALTGRLAGTQITGSEGNPNAEMVIRVRGGGSITQDNSPLYIIDGVRVENGLNNISPQDIESVDVLKDASATAIYGAAGANGVVIITTKRGKGGKTKIGYNAFTGKRVLANKLKVMTPEEFVKYQYELSRRSPQDSASFAENYGTYYDTLSNYSNTPAIDWQDQLFGQDAVYTSHNVTLDGGNNNTQFHISLTNNKEQGIMQNSDFDRKLASISLDHKVNKKLSMGMNVRFNNTEVQGAGTSNPGSSSVNNLRQTIRYRPFLANGAAIDGVDVDYMSETEGNGLNLVNPIVLNNAMYRKSTSTLLNLSGNVKYNFTDYLSLKITGGYDVTRIRQESFDDTVTFTSRFTGGKQPVASLGYSTRQSLTNSNVFTYSNAKSTKAFAKKHQISILAGQETYQNSYKSSYSEYHGFPVGIDAEHALGNFGLGTPYVLVSPSVSTTTSTSVPTVPSYESMDRILSFFGKVNYTYKDKYLLSGSLRRDGSSKFAEGNRWGNFPSLAVAWRASNESFLDFIKPVVSDLKVRFSVGQAGNNKIGNFLYITQFTPTTVYYLNNQPYSAYTPAGLAYPDLTWETTTSRNLGVDASFLKGRLSLVADFYSNSTRDLLVNVPIPSLSGYTTQIQNVGSTTNKGMEFQVNATPVQKKNLTWTMNFNVSFNKNNIESLGDKQTSYLVNSGWAGANNPADYIVKVGAPVGSMYGLVNDGFYTTDDFNYDPNTKIYTMKAGVTNSQAITSQLPQPGSIKYKDLNGDGKVDLDNDRTIIGNANPKFFGGWNNQVSFRSFDLSVYVNFQSGNDVYNNNKLEFSNAYTKDANLLAIMNDRWRTVDAKGNVIQSVQTVNGQQVVVGESPEVLNSVNKDATLWMPVTSNSAFTANSWAVEDGSFIRLNNITLGYTLPSSLMKKVKVESLRIYVTMSNLKVWTNYSGYDPEVNTRRSTPMTPGVDYSAYPRSRSYVCGLNLNF